MGISESRSYASGKLAALTKSGTMAGMAMHGGDIDAADGAGHDAAHRRSILRALIALCVVELVAWGVLFYVMPVAADPMASETGWSRSAIYGAFSIGLVVSAFVGVPVGWLLERYGPRLVMTIGTIGTVPGLLLIASAHSMTQLTLAWVLCGMTMPALFYAAAFTAVSGWMGKDRVKGLTAVTLAGGVSSTVFAPLTSALLEHFHWRTMWLIMTVIFVVILLPLQWLCLTPPWTPVRKDSSTVDVGGIVRSARFVALSASVTTFVFCGFAVAMTIVSLMVERGFGHAFGATVLGAIGVGQLLGRLGFGRFSSGTARNVRNMTIVLSLAAATMLFVIVPGPAWVMLVLAVLLGASRGAGTLMHATMVVDMWGPERYGALVGVFSMPITLAMAISPWVGASLADLLGGFAQMDTAVAVLTVLSAVGIYLTTRRPPGEAAG